MSHYIKPDIRYTPAQQRALVLRLAACEETRAWGAAELRATLRECGWTEERLERAVERVRAAVEEERCDLN